MADQQITWVLFQLNQFLMSVISQLVIKICYICSPINHPITGTLHACIRLNCVAGDAGEGGGRNAQQILTELLTTV